MISAIIFGEDEEFHALATSLPNSYSSGVPVLAGLVKSSKIDLSPKPHEVVVIGAERTSRQIFVHRLMQMGYRHLKCKPKSSADILGFFPFNYLE